VEEEAAADWIADVAVEDIVAFLQTIQNSGDQFIAKKQKESHEQFEILRMNRIAVQILHIYAPYSSSATTPPRFRTNNSPCCGRGVCV
jgi:hypothetical protein